MARYTESVRARARYLYERTDQPIRSIAAELGIGDNTLQRMKLRDGWEKRVERKRGLPVAVQLLEEAQVLALASPTNLIRHPEERAISASTRVSDALWRASKGDGPDDLQAHGPHPSRLAAARLAPQDDGASDVPLAESDQQTSTIERLEALVVSAIAAEEAARAQFVGKRPAATITERSARTLATLTQTLRALRQMRGGDLPEQGSSDDDDDMPRDIDEFRIDLARRIDAFVASRTNGGDAVAHHAPAPLGSDE
jgi:transposase-like protein